ncbi:uncharacterized protein (DUF1919 family) [Streptococcus rupicaprae]|uniref:Uncharacterized protein (DUF1919 family) n=1 Tax=Streptococcus rupicaprae TaxID=759619 RepID=A0ABV2FG55_9STRE
MLNKERVKKAYRNWLRRDLTRRNRSNLLAVSEPISIISSNCIGGVMLHDLGLPFATPTINLYFEPKSYLAFVTDLDHYLKLPLKEKLGENKPYPVGYLDEKVVIHFFHYKNFATAKAKWEERAKRVNPNLLYLILTDRDGLTREDAAYFDSLPYPNKVLLTSKPYEGLASVHDMGEAYRLGDSLMDLCQFKTKFSGRRYLDDFDYVAFLNASFKKDETE